MSPEQPSIYPPDKIPPGIPSDTDDFSQKPSKKGSENDGRGGELITLYDDEEDDKNVIQL